MLIATEEHLEVRWPERLFPLPFFFGPGVIERLFPAQLDFSPLVDPDDLHQDLIVLLDHVFYVFDPLLGQLGNMYQPFRTREDLHKSPEFLPVLFAGD